MEAVGDEIATHRFQIITKAVLYRQMHCDDSVAEQIGRSAVADWNSAKNISLAIYDRLLVLFDAANLNAVRTDLLFDTVAPFLDSAPVDSINEEQDEPQLGWPYWIAIHRECISRLRLTLGDPGRVYIHRREVRRGIPFRVA